MDAIGIYVGKISYLRGSINNTEQIVFDYLKQFVESGNCTIEERLALARKYILAADELRRERFDLDRVEKEYEQVKESRKARKSGVAGDPFVVAGEREGRIPRNLSF